MRRFAICILGAACLTACAEENNTPALVSSMFELNANLKACESCEQMAYNAELYLEKYASDMRAERDDFDKTCSIGSKDGMRCQSLRLLAGSRLEHTMAPCKTGDTAGRVEAVFQQLSDIAGVHFCK